MDLLSVMTIGDLSGLNLERLIWGDLCFIVKDFWMAFIRGGLMSVSMSDMPGERAGVDLASAIVEF